MNPYSWSKDGIAVATHQVNLDALIIREDFESGPKARGEIKEIKFTVPQLKVAEFIFQRLRKPTFQRETSNWTPRIIADFIASFLDGDIIPSIIIWKSEFTNNLFLIDGSHRVSALIAWVNGDYGDGSLSRAFWGKVSTAQARLHRDTQNLIYEKIGTYESLRAGLSGQLFMSNQMSKRVFNLNTLPLPVQSVTGEAELAERSFIKINSNPATIDKNELAIIKARAKPNAIATRALMRAGTGYPYWGKFPQAERIAQLASETYELLFGQIVDIGTRVPDVPRAGQPYSAEAFTMLLDMVNIFNNVTPSMWQETDAQANSRQQTLAGIAPNGLLDDQDGTETLEFLENVRKVARLAMSPEIRDGSLGLDQVVYSYGESGKFYPTAFIASLKFAKELTDLERYDFLKVRAAFEDFLVEHKSFIKDIGHSKGARQRGLNTFIEMYKTVFKALRDGTQDPDAISLLLLGKPELKLKEPKNTPIKVNRVMQKKFPRSVKAAAAVREALATHGRCKICGARLPFYARSQEHKLDVSKGGTGSLDNLQYVHPYCNSVKTKLEAEGWELFYETVTGI
jgi:hypothetical protein